MAKVYQYAQPPIENFIAADYVTSDIALGLQNEAGVDEAGVKFDGTKHTVAIKRFMADAVLATEEGKELDALIKERFSDECGLQNLLDTSLVNICTRVPYKERAKEAIDAGDWEAAHKAAQTALDDYRVGRRKVIGESMKAKVKKASALEAKAQSLGITMDELLERAAQLG